MVALFRPGPMDFIPGYIRRMHGEEEVEYLHPALEPIFEETYGYPVYQEQLMFAVMNLAGYTAPEADDLRKAISKKQKDKLLKHREKFIQGSVNGGIEEETACKIFDEWEEFARYGFNKAHAADYGVLAVQTAYLKTHFPVEYMTAVLSVNQSDTSKVALYAADSRRLGIEVAPPDINISAWDFSIEDSQNGPPIIRFGLGAVKNVGRAPVDVILAARVDEGPFQDINDFAHRVDLRQVGKRALECLIRVGAMDRFGDRPALLQSIDRLVSFSSSHFRAVEMGQMTLFGPDTGLQEQFALLKATTQVSHREQLNWERELIGLYVSDHPLNPVMDILSDIVTHFSGQLNEASPNDKVRLAGMITRYRTHQTRRGQSMAFATLEDLQGEVELVIFPRAWQQLSNQIEIDKLIIAEGRLDAESSEPKLLVDTIKTDLKIIRPVPSNQTPPPADDPTLEPNTTPGEEDYPHWIDTSSLDPGVSTSTVQEEHMTYPAPKPETLTSREREIIPEPVPEDTADKNLPPQPESFPEDWELTSAVMSAVADPEGSINLAETTGESDEQPSSPSPPPDTAAAVQPAGLEVEADVETNPEIAKEIGIYPMPAYLVSPGTTPDSDKVKMITIILRSGQDKVRDNLRIRQIYGTLITYPGKDRFAFHVFERSRGYLIEFPNFTTQVCPELLSRLKSFIPADEVRVEEITFQ
jgi:DNA polymerase-3 subunit alpha